MGRYVTLSALWQTLRGVLNPMLITPINVASVASVTRHFSTPKHEQFRGTCGGWTQRQGTVYTQEHQNSGGGGGGCSGGHHHCNSRGHTRIQAEKYTN